MRRITAFLNPWADPKDSGWNIIQSLLAIGSGGLFGLGLGESRQKFHYLPEQHTDFIFAIISEELGWLGSATIVALFVVLAWRGYRAALKAPDLFGCLLATGLTTMVVLQAAINIGVVTASLPATGITLPLISYGGSSLSVTLASLGVLLNISSASRKVKSSNTQTVAR
jgi:cell division protein FtsW